MKKPKRLERKQEFDLMLPSSNRDNYQSLLKILPYFFLNDDSYSYLFNYLDGKRNKSELYLDDKLKLNDQYRAWYEVELYDEKDPNFQKCRQMILDKYDSLSDSDQVRIKIRDAYYLLDNVNSFNNGRFEWEGQTVKYFRYLLKNKILTQEQVQQVTSSKNGGNKLFLCISRNPIDYLMVSTNQCFSSCIGLESEHSNAFYMGLAGCMPDPNRFLVFTTKGKIKRYSIGDYGFKHFGYTSRSWALIGKDISQTPVKYETSIIRVYPNSPIQYPEYLNQIHPDMDFFDGNSSTFESKFPFHCLKHQDGQRSMIYFDKYGFSRLSSGRVKYKSGAYPNAVCFNYHNGFDSLVRNDACLDVLNEGSIYQCHDCGDRLHEEDTWYGGDNIYCEACYFEHYFCCDDCGEYRHRDYAYFVQNQNNYEIFVCENCVNRNYEYCEPCNKYYHSSLMVIPYNANQQYCQDCSIDRLGYCDTCEEYYDIDGIMLTDDGIYCQKCYDEMNETENNERGTAYGT